MDILHAIVTGLSHVPTDVWGYLTVSVIGTAACVSQW